MHSTDCAVARCLSIRLSVCQMQIKMQIVNIYMYRTTTTTTKCDSIKLNGVQYVITVI